MRRVIACLLFWNGISLSLMAQTPALARPAAAAQKPQVVATLAQLMKGILFPSSNVIFAAQSENPADVPPAKDPSMATNPLASTYGKWEAVENSSLAIAEAANLLIIPGRKCSNGVAVPLQNADWAKFVQGLRDAGVTVYKAAQSKNQDKIVDAADVLTTACANCHEKYREKPNLADRCK
jgi:cytochrome c556